MMKPARYIHLTAACAVVACLGILWTADAAAEDEENTQASISITFPIEVDEQQELYFGEYLTPRDDFNAFQLHWETGDITMVDGDGDAEYVEGAQYGQYRLQGPSDTEIELVAEIEDFDEEGIEVTELHLEGESNSVTVQTTAGGVIPPPNGPGPHFQLGGIVEISPDAPAGTHVTTLSISAHAE